MEAFWNGFEKQAKWSEEMIAKVVKPRAMPKPGPALDYRKISKEVVSSIPKWKQKIAK